MENKKMACLDGIRGLAFLFVFIMHLIAANPDCSANVVGAGKIGVWLFFVLSAFLLFLPYWENTERKIWKEWYSFYLKRFFRIFPTYVIVLVLAVKLGFLPFADLGKHLVLQEGIGHFWTMPVELKFYILIPFLIGICTVFRGKIQKAGWFFVVLVIVQQLLWTYKDTPENSIQLKWYLSVFLMGMLTAYLYAEQRGRIRYQYLYDILALVAFFIIVCLIPGIRYLMFHIEKDGYLTNKHIFIGALWSIFLFSVLNGAYIKGFFDKCRFLQYIGHFSYPMYLTHYIFLWYYIKISGGYQWGVVIKTILSTAAVSVLLGLAVEKPFILLAGRIIKKIQNQNV